MCRSVQLLTQWPSPTELPLPPRQGAIDRARCAALRQAARAMPTHTQRLSVRPAHAVSNLPKHVPPASTAATTAAAVAIAAAACVQQVEDMVRVLCEIDSHWHGDSSRRQFILCELSTTEDTCKHGARRAVGVQWDTYCVEASRAVHVAHPWRRRHLTTGRCWRRACRRRRRRRARRRQSRAPAGKVSGCRASPGVNRKSSVANAPSGVSARAPQRAEQAKAKSARLTGCKCARLSGAQERRSFHRTTTRLRMVRF